MKQTYSFVNFHSELRINSILLTKVFLDSTITLYESTDEAGC